MIPRRHLEERFAALFGMPLEKGFDRLRWLLRNASTFTRFEAGLEIDYTTYTLDDRDLQILAFFAMTGAAYLASSDLKSDEVRALAGPEYLEDLG